MSTQNPNTPRPRRRIAGERKGQRSTPAHESPVTTEAQPTRPVAAAATQRADVPPPPPPPTVSLSKDAEEAAAPLRPVPWPVMAVLAVLAVVLLAVAAGPFVDGLGWKDYRETAEQSDIDSARRTAPAAAERAAEAILAYDYKSLEADRDAAAQFMTAAYRKEYLDTFDGLVLELAVERKTHVEADVRASGVAAAGPDRVEVLLFANQVTTSTANGGEEQKALNRVMFAMVREGAAWRVDDITAY